MHTQTTQTKRFAQHVKCCEWYYDEIENVINDAFLTDEEKIKVCQISKKAGADFVKTSTGFSRGGAVAEDVALMRKTVGPDMGVKASGGIRTLEDAEKMLEAGASRIGASAGIKIISALS